MSSTKTAGTHLASGAVKAVYKRNMKTATTIDESLQRTEAALVSLRGDLGRDAKRLAADIQKIVRTARRDTSRLSHAIQSDFERAGIQSPRTRAATRPRTPH